MEKGGIEVKNLKNLDLNSLFSIYFKEAAVKLYVSLAVCFSALTMVVYGLVPPVFWGAASFILAYPFIEYGLHRFVLHSPYLYRNKLTSKLWKRIHYDHHQDPDDAKVIFSAVDTMLPTAVILTLPLGWVVGGLAGATGALTVSLWVISFYELVHCAAHLPIEPRNPYARLLRRMHLLHHYHNECGNYGITSPVCDILFGTYYASPTMVGRSPTVRNLGYTDECAARYPWVAQLTAGHPEDRSGTSR
ncbi:sterol desaturase family protein [Rhizobium ruizarguesonis]